MITCVLASQLDDDILRQHQRAYFLHDDYLEIRELQARFPAAEIAELGDAFPRMLGEVKGELRQAFAGLGQQHPGAYWWSSHLASRSSTAVMSIRWVVFVHFAARTIATAPDEDILFIAGVPGVAAGIMNYCREQGIAARWRRRRRLATLVGDLCRWLRRTASFLRRNLVWFRACRGLPRPDALDGRQVTLMRSWLTADTIKPGQPFRDRNFGDLPEFLKQQGKTVAILPMMFNLLAEPHTQLAAMKGLGECFILPHHYVGWADVLHLLWLEVRRFGVRFSGLRVGGIDISLLLHWERRREAFDIGMMLLNLVYPTVRQLKRRGVEVVNFLTAFENKAPEKMFLLAKQEFYPQATFTGYLHTVWVADDLAHEFCAEDAQQHPLPDRIVTPGPEYVRILRETGFPPDRVVPGPALRFDYICRMPFASRDLPDEPVVVFFPLPYDDAISCETVFKLNEALSGYVPFRMLIKLHPLNKQQRIVEHIQRLGLEDWQLVEGTCAEWFPQSHLTLACGASVIQMEAIAVGVPLVRLGPRYAPFLDPMGWMDYPIPSAASRQEIRRSVDQARALDEDARRRLAAGIQDYFAPPDERELDVFFAPDNP